LLICCYRADEDAEYANQIEKEEMQIRRDSEIASEEDIELAKLMQRQEHERQKLQQQQR